MSEIAHIPQLRFPEFSGEWEEKRLGDIADFSKGKGISKSDIDNDGQLECIRYGELYTTYNELIKDVHSKTNIAKEDVKLSQIGDVIIPASGETAIDIATASCVLKDGVAIGGDLNIIRSDIDGVFNAYYLNNKNKYSVARLSQGSSVIHLYAKHLETLKLNLPTKPEQTKIAAFLTEVDTKIEQLSKKQELLGEYKKGLMQQIFSQVIRFKADDGSEFPDWEEKKLRDVAKITTGSSNREDSGLDGQYTFFDRSEDIRTSDRYLFDGKAVIVAGEGSRFPPKYFEGKFDLHQRTYAIMEFVEANSKYIFYFVDKQKNYLLRYAVGSTVKSLRLPIFQKMPVSLPSLPEQTKIANFLSSIDNKIEQVGGQLDKSKQFKKALLQQMFV